LVVSANYNLLDQLGMKVLLKEGLFFSYPNLQIITLQYVSGYKQKTPRMWGLM